MKPQPDMASAFAVPSSTPADALPLANKLINDACDVADAMSSLSRLIQDAGTVGDPTGLASLVAMLSNEARRVAHNIEEALENA